MGMDEPTIPRPLIVEFVGFTGAGKSTIQNELMNRLAARGLGFVDVGGRVKTRWADNSVVVRRLQKLLFFLRYPFMNLRLFSAAIRYVTAVKPFRFQEARWIRHLFVLDRAYKSLFDNGCSPVPRVAVCGDGFLQVIWTLTLMREPPPRQILHRMMDVILRDHDIFPILVVVSASEACSRLRNRPVPGSRLAHMSDDTVLNVLERHRETLTEIFTVSGERSSQGSLTISGADNVEENARQICQHLENIVVRDSNAIDAADNEN